MALKIKSLCYGGLFIALTIIGTIFIRIPLPATNGYIHIGDSIILLISFFYGYKYGVVSAGIGSALADILAGYAHYALFTLVIKALMALAVARLCDNSKPIVNLKNMTAFIIAEAIMIVGYFIGGATLTGSALVSLQDVPANTIQAVGGIVIFVIVGAALKKSRVMDYFGV